MLRQQPSIVVLSRFHRDGGHKPGSRPPTVKRPQLSIRRSASERSGHAFHKQVAVRLLLELACGLSGIAGWYQPVSASAEPQTLNECDVHWRLPITTIHRFAWQHRDHGRQRDGEAVSQDFQKRVPDLQSTLSTLHVPRNPIQNSGPWCRARRAQQHTFARSHPYARNPFINAQS